MTVNERNTNTPAEQAIYRMPLKKTATEALIRSPVKVFKVVFHLRNDMVSE